MIPEVNQRLCPSLGGSVDRAEKATFSGLLRDRAEVRYFAVATCRIRCPMAILTIK
jgi:hypothetical protein